MEISVKTKVDNETMGSCNVKNEPIAKIIKVVHRKFETFSEEQ